MMRFNGAKIDSHDQQIEYLREHNFKVNSGWIIHLDITYPFRLRLRIISSPILLTRLLIAAPISLNIGGGSIG